MTCASVSRLGNLLTFVHSGALAYVKSWVCKTVCCQQQIAKLETFIKNEFCNNKIYLEDYLLKSKFEECLSSFQHFGL